MMAAADSTVCVILSCPGNHLAMVNHFLQGHRNGCGFALNHHSQRIPDQDAFDIGFVKHFGGRIVVGRKHRNLLALKLHGLKCFDGYPGIHRSITFSRKLCLAVHAKR